MAAEVKKEIELEIAHVLFIDIVGYSKLLIDEQRDCLHTLNEVVRATEAFRAADGVGKLTTLPTGDGMALVFATTPEAPVNCALQISKALKSHLHLQVRMGIHSGPVSGVVDVSGRANVAGAGINMAQRVMDCGDAGHILLSKRVTDDLEQYRQWREHLHDLGECEVKHGVRVHVVNLYTDELGNPQAPETFARIKDAAALAQPLTSAPPAVKSKVPLIAVTVALVLLLALGFWLLLLQRGGGSAASASSPAAAVAPSPAVPNIPEKSIAVLPFENLSSDKENAYFADGIQDEILTRLSKIADLKVISRTSTQHYKSAPENLSEIGKQLGVAHIVEGSVQKSGDAARINVQLIKAANDSHLWAETFDRKLTDIFSVESEIAAKVADSLQAKLTGSEQRAIASKPTQNLEAYQWYLKGRYAFGNRTGPVDIKKAIEYYNQALALDPNYALAYAGLAEACAILPGWLPNARAEYFPKAKAAAEKALTIDDSLAETHVALALSLSGDYDFPGQKRELERAIALNPNYAAAHYHLAVGILTPLGNLERAVAELKRSLELDPLSPIAITKLGFAYLCAHRYPEAIAQLRHAPELEPNFCFARDMLGEALAMSGRIDEAIDCWNRSYEIGKDYHSLSYLCYGFGIKGERDKALQVVHQLKEIEERGTAVWMFGYGVIYLGLGDKERAIDCLEESWRKKESDAPFELIKVDPILDPLRGNPRFERLVTEIIPTNVE